MYPHIHHKEPTWWLAASYRKFAQLGSVCMNLNSNSSRRHSLRSWKQIWDGEKELIDTSESSAPVKPSLAWSRNMGLACPAGAALGQHSPYCPTRPCTWFRMSWLRPWHWSRGTPPASSMPSTRVVQRSLITAGTRKKGSSSNSCLGQKGGERMVGASGSYDPAGGLFLLL